MAHSTTVFNTDHHDRGACGKQWLWRKGSVLTAEANWSWRFILVKRHGTLRVRGSPQRKLHVGDAVPVETASPLNNSALLRCWNLQPSSKP